MSSLKQIAAIEAEFNDYKDSVALLRARLYRRGVATTPRLVELQRRRENAERRLRAARATLESGATDARRPSSPRLGMGSGGILKRRSASRLL